MEVNYTDRNIIVDSRKSIFLAGPTPRTNDVLSWRKEALILLEELGFDGIVYVPEDEFEYKNSYLDQVEWEKAGLTSADIIVFWIPRELSTLPAYTTNVEFGFWLAKDKDKIVYGRPDDSPKNKYLDWLYKDQTGEEPLNDLKITLEKAINKIY